MDEVLILFSDHTWLYGYEDQIEHLYNNHNWKKDFLRLRYAIIVKNWEKPIYRPNDDKNLKQVLTNSK